MEELQGTLWEPEWSITSHQEDLNCRNAREKRKKKKKDFVIIAMRSISLTISVKGSRFFC